MEEVVKFPAYLTFKLASTTTYIENLGIANLKKTELKICQLFQFMVDLLLLGCIAGKNVVSLYSHCRTAPPVVRSQARVCAYKQTTMKEGKDELIIEGF